MATKSTSRQGERRDQRRQDILDVASRLFSKLGYENVTLRAIAEEMGYAHATLYRYFPDKSHLLAEICHETFSLLISELDAISNKNPDPVERLFETARGFVRFGLKHPQHFRIVFFGPEDRNGIRAGEFINEIGRPLFDRLVKIFCDCSNGRLALSDPLLDAHTWWSSMFGITQVLITQGNLPHLSPPERVMERTIQIMWAGLIAVPQAAGKPMSHASRAKATKAKMISS
jgi:AcrR family transcriptional regulator